MTEQKKITADSFEEAVTDILLVVTDIALGDLSGQVSVPDEDDTPLGALALGINQMIDALREAQQEKDAALMELEEKLQMIERQSLAIRELSTPVLQVWEDVLVLPVIGVVDSTRSAELMERLLEQVAKKSSRYVILDITGVEIVDTRTADHFIKVIKAAQLLGASCIITGIRPAVAQTLVEIGIDLSNISTLANLKDGLRECLRRMKMSR